MNCSDCINGTCTPIEASTGCGLGNLVQTRTCTNGTSDFCPEKCGKLSQDIECFDLLTGVFENMDWFWIIIFLSFIRQWKN